MTDKGQKDGFPSFDCCYAREIIAPDSDTVVINSFLNHTLPFAPFPGLEVSDEKFPLETGGDSDAHFYGEYLTGLITKVSWKHSRFYCVCEPLKLGIRHASKKKKPTADWLKSEIGEELFYIYSQGWGFSFAVKDYAKKALSDYVESELQRLQGTTEDKRKVMLLLRAQERLDHEWEAFM